MSYRNILVQDILHNFHCVNSDELESDTLKSQFDLSPTIFLPTHDSTL